MKFRFSTRYFILTILLFIIEVLIALYMHDQFVRPYVGDLLVVILIYCFICSFIEAPVLPVAMAVLLFSYLIETLQYFNLVDRLGLGHSRLARIVIGTSFEWGDIVSYTLGIIITVWAEVKVFLKQLR